MTILKAWIQASRLPSQTYIFFPLLLGQAMAFSVTGELYLALAVAIHITGLFIQLFIVFANDYADVEADKDNFTYTSFTGGSRVLVEGLITPLALKKAILVTIVLNLGLGLLYTFFYDRELSLLFIILALLLLWMYSYRPVQLSYRGGGEFLQVFGVAIILPLLAFYIQNGSLADFNTRTLVTIIPIHLSCALSTTLPDTPSDKRNHKHTASVVFGISSVKLAIILLNSISFLLFLFYFDITLKSLLLVLAVPVLLTFYMITTLPKVQLDSKYLVNFIAVNILTIITFIGGIAIGYFLLIF